MLTHMINLLYFNILAIALYFEFENELKFYNLGARKRKFWTKGHHKKRSFLLNFKINNNQSLINNKKGISSLIL